MSDDAPRPLKLVVFDMAGTTVEDDGVVNRCFRDTLAECGLAVEPEAVDAVMGLPKPEAFRLLIGASALAARISAIHDEFVRRMVDYYADDPAVREVAGVADLFATLRGAGVKVALDTGFSRPIADAIIDRLGWLQRGLIDGCVTSDEVANGRPFPDMIERLMGQLGVSESRSVAKVGDAPADLEEGLAARCRWVIGVTWGTHTRTQLERHARTHLVDSMEELSQLLASGIAAS